MFLFVCSPTGNQPVTQEFVCVTNSLLSCVQSCWNSLFSLPHSSNSYRLQLQWRTKIVSDSGELVCITEMVDFPSPAVLHLNLPNTRTWSIHLSFDAWPHFYAVYMNVDSNSCGYSPHTKCCPSDLTKVPAALWRHMHPYLALCACWGTKKNTTPRKCWKPLETTLQRWVQILQILTIPSSPLNNQIRLKFIVANAFLSSDVPVEVLTSRWPSRHDLVQNTLEMWEHLQKSTRIQLSSPHQFQQIDKLSAIFNVSKGASLETEMQKCHDEWSQCFVATSLDVCSSGNLFSAKWLLCLKGNSKLHVFPLDKKVFHCKHTKIKIWWTNHEQMKAARVANTESVTVIVFARSNYLFLVTQRWMDLIMRGWEKLPWKGVQLFFPPSISKLTHACTGLITLIKSCAARGGWCRSSLLFVIYHQCSKDIFRDRFADLNSQMSFVAWKVGQFLQKSAVLHQVVKFPEGPADPRLTRARAGPICSQLIETNDYPTQKSITKLNNSMRTY